MASSSLDQQSKILTLKSSDGDLFEIESSIAVQSGTLKNMMEDNYYNLIPLPNVDTETLIKIIEYMKKHAVKTDSNEGEIKEFDKEFVKKSLHELFGVLLAANYLNVSGLMDLMSQSIADRIKNKSVKAVRTIFGITNDYTPEEEEKVRQQHHWAHEGKEIDESID
ncbi:unnamed protein product [Withania somnifera]